VKAGGALIKSQMPILNLNKLVGSGQAIKSFSMFFAGLTENCVKFSHNCWDSHQNLVVFYEKFLKYSSFS
jgi:hypothetical protein